MLYVYHVLTVPNEKVNSVCLFNAGNSVAFLRAVGGCTQVSSVGGLDAESTLDWTW